MFESGLNRFIIVFLAMWVGQVVVIGSFIEFTAWLLPKRTSQAFVAKIQQYDAVSWSAIMLVSAAAAIYAAKME